MPVYMWFHGGGLNNGHPYEPEFDGSELARKGVVVVQVGQRLNVFGYLALPQLSAEQGGKSGNYGFMDQLAALDWVYENIAAFGGDPDNITVGGQSGGSQKAGAMATTPAAHGRVRRAILESGLKWLQRFPTLAEMEEKCRNYLRSAGIDPDAPLDQLRAIDATRFWSGERTSFRCRVKWSGTASWCPAKSPATRSCSIWAKWTS
jgi:para-nitrobenzyl esterase